MTHDKVPYFVDPAEATILVEMPGLETTVLTGLHGESMMMVLNATKPGHIGPHPIDHAEWPSPVCGGTPSGLSQR